MKILNLYAGVGGNRLLWGNDHDITAVEYDKGIAGVYADLYPNDKVIIDSVIKIKPRRMNIVLPDRDKKIQEMEEISL